MFDLKKLNCIFNGNKYCCLFFIYTKQLSLSSCMMVRKILRIKSFKQKLKLEKIAEVKEKKRGLEAAIKSLVTDIEEYSVAAEKEHNLTMLTKTTPLE